MSILAVLASQTNPLVPTAWEGIGAGSAIAYRQPKPQTACP